MLRQVGTRGGDVERQADREIVVAKLAEWGITPNEDELDQLVVAYQRTLQWQRILEETLHQRKIVEGTVWPESEPLLIHCVEKKRDSK